MAAAAAARAAWEAAAETRAPAARREKRERGGRGGIVAGACRRRGFLFRRADVDLAEEPEQPQQILRPLVVLGTAVLGRVAGEEAAQEPALEGEGFLEER